MGPGENVELNPGIRKMLYGLFELLRQALNEFRGLSEDFYRWVAVAVILACLVEALFWLSGRLVLRDWRPGWILGGVAGLWFPLTCLIFLSLPATAYLKPAAETILKTWQTGFTHDDAWNQESFRQQYWAVQALKTPDGQPLENFSGYPSPEQGGTKIPASHRESQSAIATIDSNRVAEHFQTRLPLLAQLLWADERPLPEVLRGDMEKFFRDNPGTAYDHFKAVQLAGTEMQRLLEQKIGRIVLMARLGLAGLLLLLWLPLFALAVYDAWKRLEPTTLKE